MRVLLPVFAVLLAVASYQLYCRDPARVLVELRGRALGTTWSVKLATTGLSEEVEQATTALIALRLERVDALMSTWKADSELSRFNTSASTAPFAVSAETLAVFEIAQQVSRRSGGAFDVTVGPLVQAWGFGSQGRSEPPDPAILAVLRESVGYEKLVVDSASSSLSKRVPGLEADLSAVAKGYAVDLVALGLDELRHGNYLVELGGELRARGAHLDGTPWRVAIETPDGPGRAIHRVVELKDLSMATSGDYRNYYERQDGRRLSHTIDPRTGTPIDHGLASVTVLHPQAAWADAWATALNVLGPEAGYDLAVAEGLAVYLIVRRPGARVGQFDVRMTPAFEPHLAESAPLAESRARE